MQIFSIYVHKGAHLCITDFQRDFLSWWWRVCLSCTWKTCMTSIFCQTCWRLIYSHSTWALLCVCSCLDDSISFCQLLTIILIVVVVIIILIIYYYYHYRELTGPLHCHSFVWIGLSDVEHLQGNLSATVIWYHTLFQWSWFHFGFE